LTSLVQVPLREVTAEYFIDTHIWNFCICIST
jgi:hypothetical protein